MLLRYIPDGNEVRKFLFICQKIIFSLEKKILPIFFEFWSFSFFFKIFHLKALTGYSLTCQMFREVRFLIYKLGENFVRWIFFEETFSYAQMWRQVAVFVKFSNVAD